MTDPIFLLLVFVYVQGAAGMFIGSEVVMRKTQGRLDKKYKNIAPAWARAVCACFWPFFLISDWIQS